MASNTNAPREPAAPHPRDGREPPAPATPKDAKPPMRHDLTGEFDYGVEGGQTQDHGPDRTDGKPGKGS